VICGKPVGPFVVADGWLAAENLMLAAWAMGLGTCVIGSAVPALNTRDLKAGVGIPDEFSAIAPIIVGVPRGVTPPATRQPPHVLSWT
jgi:nitroreductase